MMQIVYFSQKQQFLQEMDQQDGEKVYIAPSPSKADSLRRRLVNNRGNDVITIAKFTSGIIETLWPNENRPQLKKKSELLLIFGILKNRILEEITFEQFNQAYNLFSDLRSFTLNQDILSSVLDEQPEIIKKAVTSLWGVLNQLGYLDEHAAYQIVAERLRSSDEIDSLRKVFIFWGFQHLNGQQVDLLKALSIRYNVIIPFPLDLKEKIKKSDWVSWIKDSRTLEVELPKITLTPKASWIPTNSREMSQELKNIIHPETQIVLGVNKLDQSHIELVPSNKLKFKIPHQILKNELFEVSEKIKKFQGHHQELNIFCQNQILNELNPKKIKCWQLYVEALNFVSEFTDPIRVDDFLLKTLFQVVSLNQPRTSFVSTSECLLTIDLKDMSSLEDLDRNRKVVICIDERFNEIQSLSSNYTETILQALSSIGPIKRNELELLFKQWEFRDLLSQSEVLILMNEGILKHSLIWKRMFSGIEPSKIEKIKDFKSRGLKDHLSLEVGKKFEGHYSVSKIQTYIDCPRKFYFNFVDKVIPRILIEKDFDPLISGSILHEIIELFFKEKWVDSEFSQLTQKVVSKYILENNLHLPPDTLRERLLTFTHRAWNGIEFIRKIDSLAGGSVVWKFEEPFDQMGIVQMKGRIDCIGIGSNHIFLLDFKSTEMSASTASEVVDFKSIQLWVYAQAARNLFKEFDQKNIVMGYVVLDDPTKSILLTSDEEILSHLKNEKLCKIHKFKEDFTELLENSGNRVLQIKESILSEVSFPPRPRKPFTCTYCEVNKICIKSELVHE